MSLIHDTDTPRPAKPTDWKWLQGLFASVVEFAVWLLILLLVKAFLFQPFRVYGESMMNTLHPGDLLIVGKASYSNVLGGSPQPGDVVVLRPPVQASKERQVYLGDSGEEIIYLSRRTTNKDNILVELQPADGETEVPAGITAKVLPELDNQRLTTAVQELFNLAFYNRVSITGPAGSNVRVLVHETPDYYIKRIIGVPGDTIRIAGGLVYRNGTALSETYLSQENAAGTYAASMAEQTYEVPEGEYFVLGDNRLNSLDSRTCFRGSCTADTDTPFLKKDEILGKALLVFWPWDQLGADLK